MRRLETWKMKVGGEIPIRAMGDQHLINAARMSDRFSQHWSARQRFAWEQTEDRPTTAADRLCDKYDYWATYWLARFEELSAEVRRRRLKLYEARVELSGHLRGRA